MLRYHGDELLSHRLLLLCHIPESTEPTLYAPLLPGGEGGDGDEGLQRIIGPWTSASAVGRGERDRLGGCGCLFGGSSCGRFGFVRRLDDDLHRFVSCVSGLVYVLSALYVICSKTCWFVEWIFLFMSHTTRHSIINPLIGNKLHR